MGLKHADGMANRIDPDQTRSSLIWVYTVCPDLSVRKLRNITFNIVRGGRTQKNGAHCLRTNTWLWLARVHILKDVKSPLPSILHGTPCTIPWMPRTAKNTEYWHLCTLCGNTWKGRGSSYAKVIHGIIKWNTMAFHVMLWIVMTNHEIP